MLAGSHYLTLLRRTSSASPPTLTSVLDTIPYVSIPWLSLRSPELTMKSTVILKASLNYFIVFIFSLYLSLLFIKITVEKKIEENRFTIFLKIQVLNCIHCAHQQIVHLM